MYLVRKNFQLKASFSVLIFLYRTWKCPTMTGRARARSRGRARGSEAAAPGAVSVSSLPVYRFLSYLE